MARQARRAANLVPGASLRGLVFDGCYDNRIPHTFGMLRHFGLPNRNRVLVSESLHLNTAGLADALRIPESEVLARRYPAYGRGHCSFFGLHVMKRRIEDRVRRFSPTAISRGYLHHPATHELRDLPFSTLGWDLLQSRCPCTEDGVEQNWVTTNGSFRCHSCGGSLGRITPIPVPDELRMPLELLANLVDPDPVRQKEAIDTLPVAIRGAGRTLLYDMIMNVARALGADEDDEDPRRRLQALASACEAISKWPAGLDAISRSDHCPVNVWEWVRRHHAMLDVCSGTMITKSRDPSTDSPSTTVQTGQGVVYAPTGSLGRIKTSLIGAMAAARLGGVDEIALKEAWDSGHFTQHHGVQGPLKVRWFDPAEVIAVAPLLRVSGGRSRAARHLGLPLYGLEQLIERGLFAPSPPTVEMKQVAVHMEEARRLATELDGRKAEIADGISFLEAIRHVSGRMKPWGAAIAAMLEGEMPFALSREREGVPLATRLHVGREAIPWLLAQREPEVPRVAIPRAKHWMQEDALECLNGNVNAPELLRGLARTGTARKIRFSARDVIDRAGAGVTTADLARRSGRSIMRTAMILREAQTPQIASGLWLRAAAEAAMGGHEQEAGKRKSL